MSLVSPKFLHRMNATDNMTLRFKQVQQEHVAVLKESLSLCEALSPGSKASQRSLKEVNLLLSFVSNSLRILIAKHTLLSPSDLLPRQLFADVELLNTYKDVLFGAIKLIFTKETSAFRMKSEPNFTICIVRVYVALTEFHRMWASETLQLKSMIHAFQYQFGSNYNIANCNILNLNQVHDLLSQTFDLISPPLVDIHSVAKRDYFHLTIERFGYKDLLVEIFQLANGELAIFKVNCGELPTATNMSGELLQRMAQGDNKLLDLGRTLLFPAFREYDLEVVNLLVSGTELRTPTGNKVSLKLQCVDTVQWESHWKFCFQKLFDKNNIIPPVLQSSTLAPMARCSHPFQSFKFKHQKLEDLRPNDNSGIAIELPQHPAADVQQRTEKMAKEPKKNSFRLHKSKPLQRPLSSLMDDLDMEDVSLRSSAEGNMFKSPSLRDIENLSCSKLLELDQSIHMNLSQTKVETPTMKECKSTSQHSSLERIGSIIEGNYEVSDLESDSDEEDKQADAIFNPSAEVYKPTLYRRKSSSLLNLFRSKNKKKVTADAKGANEGNKESAGSLFGSSKSISSSISSKSSAHSLLKLSNSVEVPQGVDLDDDMTVFATKITRISSWNGRLWDQIKGKKLQLTILKSAKNATVLVIHEEKEAYYCKLAARVTSQWKCCRGSAQDVQVWIPTGNFMTSCLPEDSNSLNIRCTDAERLQNFLQHCMKDVLPTVVLPNSATAATLSSNGSSLLSDLPLSNISSLKVGSEAANLTLLMPSVTVKRYMHLEGSEWQPHIASTVDVYSRECKGLMLGVIFRFLKQEKIADTLLVGLNDIRRIGATGILLTCKNEEQLLEFENKAITDQFHRLIRQ